MAEGFLESVNPTTGEVLERVPQISTKEMSTRVDFSVEAFRAWRKTPFPVRSQCLRTLANLLRSRSETLSRIMAREMGKPVRQGVAEANKCASVCDYYAEHGESQLTDEVVRTEARTSLTRFEPLGPILAIMPWNFPLWQVFRFASPAIAAGNVALLKHASNVPRCALTIEEFFLEAGFPKGVFQTLLLDRVQTNALIADERVRGLSLTGGDATGQEVGRLAGGSLKPMVLELGGSDPFIVLENANLAIAARNAVEARVVNSGESCIAAKRFIVAAPVLSEFLDRMRTEMRKLKVGNPLEEDTDVGPLARRDLVDALDVQVKRSIAAGARLELGGEALPGPGNFYRPTILSGVTPGMAVFDEETFGPVAAVTEASGTDDAIRLANLSRYGLGASIWTADVDQGIKLAAEIEAGMVFINAKVMSDPRLPFGGVKRSGFGRELGRLGIREFVNAKTVWASS